MARDQVQFSLERVESERLLVAVSRSDMASLTSVGTSVSQAQRRASFQRTMMGVGVVLGGIWLGVITYLYLTSAVDTVMSMALIGARPALSTVVALALLTLLGVVAHLTRQPWLRGDCLMSLLGCGVPPWSRWLSGW